MKTSKFITAVVGNEKITIAEPITRVDYGLRLMIKGIALPDSYEVDFSQNEEGGESVTVIGDAQGAEIPAFLIKTGKDIFAFLYWVGEGYGRRVKTIQIPNDAGPERTDVEVEPAEQSVIDQTIARVNAAAQKAEDAADTLKNPAVEVEMIEDGSEASAEYDDGTFRFRLPGSRSGGVDYLEVSDDGLLCAVYEEEQENDKC